MLNEEEIKEIQKIAEKSEAVEKLLEFYQKATQDPEGLLRHEMKEMAAVIATDFKTLRTEGEVIDMVGEGDLAAAQSNLKILASNKNDKLFDRVLSIFDKAGKIMESISIEKVKEEKKGPVKKGHEEKSIV